MNFFDLLFPKNCLECKKAGKYICNECLVKVEAAKLICPVCKKYSFNGQTHSFCVNKFSLNGIYCFYKYEGVIRKAILAIKYRFAFDITKELVEGLNMDLNLRKAVIVPVPLHIKREKWRGFNQAALLGKLLADKAKLKFNDKLVLRLENSSPQVKLGKVERLQNIRGKFAVNSEVLRAILSEVEGSQPTFVLFDDVWTTGATINEVAKELKKAGAKEVWGMSVAKS